MANKKSTQKGVLYYLGAVILGIVSLAMMFTKSITIKNKYGGLKFTGVEATFGYAEKTIVGKETVIGFSFLNFVAYLLVLAAVVLVVLRILKVLKADVMDLVVAVVFAVAGILFFFMPGLAAFKEPYATLVSENVVDAKLLVGGILSAVCSLLAAGALVAKKFLNK